MINETHDDKDAENDALNVVLNVASQIPPFLTVILEVVARAVCTPSKYSWLLADILRITSEHSCSLLIYYMSSVCPATSAVRLQCISRVISVTNQLRHRSECKTILDTLPKRLFQFRLECSLELEWGTIDPALLSFFQNESDLRIVKELVLSAIQRLADVPTSNELKVRMFYLTFFSSILIITQDLLCTYLHHAFQGLDAEFLTNVKESINQLPSGKERDELLRNITNIPHISNFTILTKAKSQKGRLVMAPHIWRERVQNLVHEIVTPDSPQWMDDDDGMSVAHICRRSLQEVQIRFEQRVRFLCYIYSIDIFSQTSTSFYCF